MYTRTLLFIVILFLNFTSLSASDFLYPPNDTLTSIEASKKVGETVLMKGKVVSINKMSSKADRPLIYINLDYAYPKNPITIMVVGKNVAKFSLDERIYLNKEVLIEGTVIKNKSYKPTIFLNEQNQLKLFLRD